MSRPHLLAAVAIAGVLLTGCQSKPPVADSDASPHPVLIPVTPRPAAPIQPQPAIALVNETQGVRGADAAHPSPEMALAKVQSMTQNLGPLLDKRAHAGEPSAVEWVDPEAMRLTDAAPRHTTDVRTPTRDPQPTVVQLVHPAIDSSPTAANQVAFISPGINDGLPGDGRLAAMQAGVRVTADVPGRLAPRPSVPGGDSLEQRLAQRIKDYPHDTAAALDYQLLQFLHDEPVPQMEALAPLPGEERELISATLDALSNFRNVLRADNNLLLSKKVRPLLELADRLRAQSELNIPTLALCTKVDGFGSYEPLEPARFVAGKDHMVILYCEVENFSSRQDSKQLWVTRLQQEAVLYTETGLPIWEDKTKGIVDLSRNRRHDFFVVKLVKLPATLTIGRYLMKVSVVDQLANRIAESSVPVQIVAQ